MTRIVLLLATLAALAPLATAAAPDVRQNTVCHSFAALSGCSTATLVGTLAGCVGTTCQAHFTLDLDVAGAAYCGLTYTDVTTPILTECVGLFDAPTATGTVVFTAGDAVVVRGILCAGLPAGPQKCVQYQETFAF